MMITDAHIPDCWTLDSDEIAPYVFKVIAIARDGRRIESTGSDEEALRKEVIESIKDSDAQVARLMQDRRAKPTLRWERVVIGLCLLDLTWFVLAFMVHPSWASVARNTMVPSMPLGGVTSSLVFLVIAIVGTIAPWQLFFQRSCVAVVQAPIDRNLTITTLAPSTTGLPRQVLLGSIERRALASPTHQSDADRQSRHHGTMGDAYHILQALPMRQFHLLSFRPRSALLVIPGRTHGGCHATDFVHICCPP
jgi:hypothetical protein